MTQLKPFGGCGSEMRTRWDGEFSNFVTIDSNISHFDGRRNISDFLRCN